VSIEWEHPPAIIGRGRKHGAWLVELEQLRERPGEWARVLTTDKGDGASARATRINRLGDEWEAVSRRVDAEPPEWGVWARLVVWES